MSSTERYNMRNHWGYLALAVLDVYETLNNYRSVSDPDCKSDNWVIYGRYFRRLMDGVTSEWEARVRQIVGHDEEELDLAFPWSDDAVKRQWMRYRKRSDDQRASYRKEILAAINKNESR